ncbi:MAG TPA: inositol-3-phosphate synthase [Candidatus Omnitrophica bacterium]|nr:MAG: inositol-3-phosphate synthase [Omnitrophica WOR_2 bacterium GWA2_63_20]OGX17402.1 MAG: inositol-3-phosphate synthase [Omnitrophica WOR_2 bacterium GWF2_63_9]OGX32338.1 MAG: inositol-3-phosphate synthase [Omnitrophica WOR_2 bacterium RIFCSPHIGHO2_12_FULL_64_13]OGX35243.1 MAG: inositol-3-phosphate synthase [Omnitrophica WOR_2 bacterium RIFCSPHIGHO2_02_FULL_63_39]OGX45086.1 MAG: inositol-3-phosphate synthase [Omnitrophica WOR_2 bacterium RIFCSPLOWO2_02_FULL_63_16]OGX48971.1 MAG: inositol-
MKSSIRIAVIGVGNCASSLLQGLGYYARPGKHHVGLLHDAINGYRPEDIQVVAAFDVDARKVGKPLREACAAKPNCTTWFVSQIPNFKVRVHMGPLLDGVAPHMANYPADRTFVIAKQKPAQLAKVLRASGAEIAVNYLPVGSEQATKAYAAACLETGVSLLNCMPVFIVSDPTWANRFAKKNIPIVGDDVKGQLGATILHRTLAKLFNTRGVRVDRTYQLNVGGNTDFLNMLNRDRLASKKISKTEAVQSVLENRLPYEQIHIGPSDYVPWQNDRKVCFLRLEGRGFGGCPMELELRLSVEDSPNSAGMVIDAIRCLRLARDRRLGGPLRSVSAWTMKHPPQPMDDEHARQLVEAFVRGTSRV